MSNGETPERGGLLSENSLLPAAAKSINQIAFGVPRHSDHNTYFKPDGYIYELDSAAEKTLNSARVALNAGA